MSDDRTVAELRARQAAFALALLAVIGLGFSPSLPVAFAAASMVATALYLIRRHPQ